MPSPRFVPLALCNLTHDRVRFALFALGITFAVVLMTVQMGIRNALVDSNCQLVDKLEADIILVHPYRASLFYREGVSRRRMAQAMTVAGVASVHSLYIDYQFTLLTHTGKPGVPPEDGARKPSRSIRVIGLDPEAGLLNFPELKAGAPERTKLLTPGTALFDRLAKADPERSGQTVYGPIPQGKPWTTEIATEINGRALTLVGAFDLGADFAADGTLIMSEQTFLKLIRTPLYPQSATATVDIGLIRVNPEVSPILVRDRLRLALDAESSDGDRDVDVLTKAEFREREAEFWLSMTPIGFAFNIGIGLAFLVGSVICYQILAGDVADHLSEYATLRAIGYPNRYLSGVVLQEAVILAIAGFLPGMLISLAAFQVMIGMTGLPFEFTLVRVGWVLLSTIAMCVGSGLLALRKAQTVDPANVF